MYSTHTKSGGGENYQILSVSHSIAFDKDDPDLMVHMVIIQATWNADWSYETRL